MYKATQLSACVASARWCAGERSRSGGVHSVARRALTLLNAPLVVGLLVTEQDIHSGSGLVTNRTEVYRLVVGLWVGGHKYIKSEMRYSLVVSLCIASGKQNRSIQSGNGHVAIRTGV